MAEAEEYASSPESFDTHAPFIYLLTGVDQKVYGAHIYATPVYSIEASDAAAAIPRLAVLRL